MVDYSKWDNAKLLTHAKEIAALIRSQKIATADLIDELANRLNDRSPFRTGGVC